MLYRAISRFSTAEGSLDLAYSHARRRISGPLTFVVRNNATGESFQSYLDIDGVYNHSRDYLDLATAEFRAASFEISQK